MFFQDAIALVEKNYSLITWDPNRSPQKDVRCPHRPHGPPHFVVMNEPAFPPLSSWESQGGPPPKKPPHLFHPKKYVACSLRIMVVHMWPPLRVVPQWGKMPLRLHPIGWSLKVPGNPPTEAPCLGAGMDGRPLDVNRRWDVGWLWTTEREGGCCWPLLGFLGHLFQGWWFDTSWKNGTKFCSSTNTNTQNASISWHMSDVLWYYR